MSKDLRQFLEVAKKAGPEWYVEVKRPLNRDVEVNYIQEKLDKLDRNPVIYVPEMKGYKMPYCTNLFGSFDMLGLGLGMDPEYIKQVGKYGIQMEYWKRKNDLKPKQWVSRSEAPVKDVVIKGEDIDILEILPVPKGQVGDVNPYITSASCICKDPDKGIPNMGVYRHEVKGKDLLGCWIGPAHHGAYNARSYAKLGKNMEVALMIGHHLAASMAACQTGPLELDEMEVAGGLLGEPLRVTQGETVDLPVPADAEIIIEGWIDPNEWVTDGPFGEYSGYYGNPAEPCYLIHVTCITMRKDAIYHGLDSDHREHNIWGQLPGEIGVYEVIKRRIPTLKAVNAPQSGRRFHYYVSISKGAMGEGMLAGLLAVSAEKNATLAIVVDDDVDVFDEERVLWAVATRVGWDRQVAFIPQVLGAEHNPTSHSERGVYFERGNLTTKVIIDATKPVGLPYPVIIDKDKELWDKMKLEDYILER